MPNKNKTRDIPISIYPPIMKYNKKDVSTIMSGIRNTKSDILLYIHIPFCPQKCDFCYFTSFPCTKKIMTDYVNRLCEDIKKYSEICNKNEKIVKSVYIGGGTPTFLTDSLLENIFNTLYKSFNISKSCEICIEARPGSEATISKLKLLKEIGVNRVSMGVQSFDDDILQLNGRKSNSYSSILLYKNLKSCGFENINIDIMSGMIGETNSTWNKTIQMLLELDPANITIYKMQLYENSIMSKKEYGNDLKVNYDKELDQTKLFYKELIQKGYSLSTSTYSFTKSKKYTHIYRELRNEGAEIVALGLSANGYYNDHVYQSTYDLHSYLNNKNIISSAYYMKPDEINLRGFILGLKSGCININKYIERYGYNPLMIFERNIERLLADGIISVSSEKIKIIDDNIFFVDYIIREYIMPTEIKKMERLLLQYKNFNLKGRSED